MGSERAAVGALSAGGRLGAQSSLSAEKPASLRVLTAALISWPPEEPPPSPGAPGGQGQQLR